MAEWLHEAGIGEERAILVESGRIIAARVVWDELWRAGAVAEARLIARIPGTRRAAVRLPDGSEALAEGLDPALTEGAAVRVRVTRAAIAERGRTKLPHVRPFPAPATTSDITQTSSQTAPSLFEELGAGAIPVRSLRIHDRSFEHAGWDDVLGEAQTGEVPFPGGSLIISPTPAMTLIDIDGPPPLINLALAAVPTIIAALLRLDIGGSVGIDFPSLPEKAQRHAVDAALADAAQAAGWHGERTAMNGFGFVQLVARLEHPSLIARYARYPAAAAARQLLRQAERVAEPGTLLLTAHPAVRRAISAAWEGELARRTGRLLRWHEDAGLALAAAFAQAIAA